MAAPRESEKDTPAKQPRRTGAAGSPSENDRSKLIAWASEARADVIVYRGEVNSSFDGAGKAGVDQLRDQLSKLQKKAPRCILVLTTLGGVARGAFQIARTLQDHYPLLEGDPDAKSSGVTAFVPVIAKSAGTLLVSGAHRLVMCDEAELGPLDVQLFNEERPEQRLSGSAADDAFSKLASVASSTFKGFFQQLYGGEMGYPFSSRFAAEVAAKLVVGLLGPVYGQIDPLRLGEIHRALNVAIRYSQLLNREGRNLKKNAALYLTVGYPDHAFVIDRTEAAQFFERLEKPDQRYLDLRQLLTEENHEFFATSSKPVIVEAFGALPA